MKSAHSCRLCGHWIEGDWNAAPKGPDGDAQRARAEAEMAAGHCSDCFPTINLAAVLAALEVVRRELGRADILMPDGRKMTLLDNHGAALIRVEAEARFYAERSEVANASRRLAPRRFPPDAAPLPQS